MKRKLIVFGSAGVLIVAAIAVFCDRKARREARAMHTHVVVTQEGQIKLVPNDRNKTTVVMDVRKKPSNTTADPTSPASK